MAGTLSVSGTSLADTHSCSCLCLNPTGTFNFKTSGDLGLWRGSKGRKHLNLSSSFLEAWCEWRFSAKMLSLASTKRHKLGKFTVVSGLEEDDDDDSGEDVKNEIINVMTYKAVRTVLHQLYEMNPPQYTWFYNFVVNHLPNTGKNFLQQLFKEKRELAERVMITRLHLYSIWMKKCDHTEIYNRISDQNVELMRERLAQTVKWASEDEVSGSLD